MCTEISSNNEGNVDTVFRGTNRSRLQERAVNDLPFVLPLTPLPFPDLVALGLSFTATND
jgi:hypothetical protein